MEQSERDQSTPAVQLEGPAPDLIYDVGVHDGADTAYYLHKGFRVVGIEASPVMISHLKCRFAREIGERRLTLLHVGIADRAGRMEFYVCDEVTEWSSFNREIASRNNARHHTVQVPTDLFSSIIRAHGVPYYCKIDIEGNDRLCISSLDPEIRPKYISVEMSHEQGDQDLKALRRLGYREFKIISQLTRATPLWPANEMMSALPPTPRAVAIRLDRLLRGRASDGSWRFVLGSSGPFGENTPGSWRSFEQTLSTWERLRDLGRAYGTHSGVDWFDIHAR